MKEIINEKRPIICALLCSCCMIIPSIYFTIADILSHEYSFWETVISIAVSLLWYGITFAPFTISIFIVAVVLSLIFNDSLNEYGIFWNKNNVNYSFTILDLILTIVILLGVHFISVTVFGDRDVSVFNIYDRILFGYLYSDY